ncbi:hypothetical protein RJT34_33438 [Clitoria ternatea]|uniref:Uncharacterized protein n=1 Tax=Clitoria ternatea TaxID=43366 RepID=A0AAN9EXU4_CLITE
MGTRLASHSNSLSRYNSNLTTWQWQGHKRLVLAWDHVYLHLISRINLYQLYRTANSVVIWTKSTWAEAAMGYMRSLENDP